MTHDIMIEGRAIGPGHSTYIIAELSANHNNDIDRARETVKAAARSGASAIKLQTYTPDTITFDGCSSIFQIDGTIWAGRTLYDLYEEAYMPWEWHAELFDLARTLGMHAFSTPFDFSSIDFLTALRVPAWKIASAELIDLPLICRVARSGKPVLISTGMGTKSEIDEAIATLRNNNCHDIVMLKCTAAYPAPPDEANLLTIPDMAKSYNVVTGLSDHTLGTTSAIIAVALGASVIEKHFTLSRSDGGVDSSFSLEPHEFADMVQNIRLAEKSLGSAVYAPSDAEIPSRKFRRSLFIVKDIQKGEKFTTENVRSIRPADGLHTRYYEMIIGKSAICNIVAGTPLELALIA